MKHPLRNEIDQLVAYAKIQNNLDSLYETCLKYAVNNYDLRGEVNSELAEVLDAIAPYIPEEDHLLVQKMYEEMGSNRKLNIRS